MKNTPDKAKQGGSTTVEFALVFLIFMTFLLAITDFSRMLFMWNAANEATRAGARYAVVCDSTAQQAQVLARMQALMPQITTSTWCGLPRGATPPRAKASR